MYPSSFLNVRKLLYFILFARIVHTAFVSCRAGKFLTLHNLHTCFFAYRDYTMLCHHILCTNTAACRVHKLNLLCIRHTRFVFFHDHKLIRAVFVFFS